MKFLTENSAVRVGFTPEGITSLRLFAPDFPMRAQRYPTLPLDMRIQEMFTTERLSSQTHYQQLKARKCEKLWLVLYLVVFLFILITAIVSHSLVRKIGGMKKS